MAGRASIVGAAVTHVGNVRDHNEDSHFFDADLGLFLICDGMGGHAAGEVASAIAIQTIRQKWLDADTTEVADVWLDRGTAIAKKQLIEALRDGVLAAHNAIIAEGNRDPSKAGMGTTLVAAIVVGNELIFAHAGDSRAYIVRDGISMQLTEDHTLLQRLLAAGIDVDVSGDGSRFRSMLTNALGIGQECKVSTFVVPLADGDRFMLCTDGVSEYVPENEVGDVLVKQPSPARAAQKLVELALERGGADNATAIVMRVLEAGETPVPAEQRRRDDLSISLCELWSEKVSPQQRLRALRIAIPREHAVGDKLPAHTLGDRVAWIIVEGEVAIDGEEVGPGGFIYPESLIAGSAVPDKDALAVARTEVRAVAIRNDDFRELCEDDTELGEALLEQLAAIIGARTPKPPKPKVEIDPYGKTLIQHAPTDPRLPVLPPAPAAAAPKVDGRAATPPAGTPVARTAATIPRAGTAPAPVADKPAQSRAPTPQVVTPPSLVREATRPPSDPEIEISKMSSDLEQGPEPQLAAMTRAAAKHKPRLITEPEIETVFELEADEPNGEGAPDVPRARAITADDSPSASGSIERPPTRSKRLSDGWDE